MFSIIRQTRHDGSRTALTLKLRCIAIETQVLELETRQEPLDDVERDLELRKLHAVSESVRPAPGGQSGRRTDNENAVACRLQLGKHRGEQNKLGRRIRQVAMRFLW